MKKVLSVMALLIIFSCPVNAELIIDQNNPSLNTNFGLILGFGNINQQSFKQTNSNIAGAGTFLFRERGTSGTVTISVWDALPNQIGAKQLASGSAIGNAGSWVDVFWTPIPVTPGTTYYLDFTAPNNDLLATTYNPFVNSYIFGEFYQNYRQFADSDITFRTYYDDSLAPPVSNAILDVSPANLWIGLKNSDDQGTQFDLKTELYKNDVLISDGKSLCITGVTRNPSLAKEASVVFGPVSNGDLASGDTLSLKVFTRIGTTPDGMKCSGPGGSHNNAVGLRLYYDAPTRPSGFGAEISPDPLLNDLFLHSSGTNYFFDEVSPAGTVKYKDSGSVNFNNGNPWKEIGTWSMPLQ